MAPSNSNDLKIAETEIKLVDLRRKLRDLVRRLRKIDPYSIEEMRVKSGRDPQGYISADYLNDNPQQSNVTEAFGLSSDTIVTHVLRNGTLETYTFHLPVVTRTIHHDRAFWPCQ
jgi:hypothetical protein